MIDDVWQATGRTKEFLKRTAAIALSDSLHEMTGEVPEEVVNFFVEMFDRCWLKVSVLENCTLSSNSLQTIDFAVSSCVVERQKLDVKRPTSRYRTWCGDDQGRNESFRRLMLALLRFMLNEFCERLFWLVMLYSLEQIKL